MKTVFVAGYFNILHPGHLRLLRFAKECGDLLEVAIISDEMSGEKAYINQEVRLESIRTNSFVDHAFILNESVETYLLKNKPDIVVKGKEHELEKNVEESILKSYGGQLIFSSGEATFSSIDLIRNEFKGRSSDLLNVPKEYMKRHDISKKRLIDILRKTSEINVCIIGDLIVDEYVTCQMLGVSQEDPTIVVTPIDSTKFIGGAGIVASHASGLGANVHFICVSGDDEAMKFSVEQLKSHGIHFELVQDFQRPTTLKKRYRSFGKNLLKVSYLHETDISTEHQNEIFLKFSKVAEKIDLLVFSDFNYGCLPTDLVRRITTVAREKNRNIFIAADSQSSSQIGDIGRFENMDLITPTEREARLSIGSKEDGLIILAERLKKKCNAKNIFLKLGAEGLLIHASNVLKSDKKITDRIVALNTSPKDVSGAGDSMLISAALCLTCGGSVWEAGIIGSIAAGIQVGRVGNTPLTLNEILSEL